MRSSWRESRFWLRRPRFTNESAMLRRSTTCSTARPIALSCTVLSASTAPATSAPPRTWHRFDLWRHDVLAERRLEDLVHRVRQTLARHDAASSARRLQRPGDPAVGQGEHEQRQRDGADRGEQVVALLRRRVVAQPVGAGRRRSRPPPPARCASPRQVASGRRVEHRPDLGRSGLLAAPSIATTYGARSGWSSTSSTGASYGPTARLRTALVRRLALTDELAVSTAAAWSFNTPATSASRTTPALRSRTCRLIASRSSTPVRSAASSIVIDTCSFASSSSPSSAEYLPNSVAARLVAAVERRRRARVSAVPRRSSMPPSIAERRAGTRRPPAGRGRSRPSRKSLIALSVAAVASSASSPAVRPRCRSRWRAAPRSCARSASR